ncbi:MAG: GNAT family N-acetyltransferase [Clostridiales bacterium]|nr:GNAT family N-acetyltransferase [Clostridiales bacterium]
MILKADGENLAHAAALACELWPGHTPEELLAELEALSRSEGAVFLAVEDGAPAGFAQCQLRHDYVEGTGTSPVGYLEGVYVREEYRGRGLAKELLRACEGWAREQGCLEFASDCELDNGVSIAFHLGSGFAEANRIVCFTKRLGEEA